MVYNDKYRVKAGREWELDYEIYANHTPRSVGNIQRDHQSGGLLI
jgi:hypothetical protein